MLLCLKLKSESKNKIKSNIQQVADSKHKFWLQTKFKIRF